MLSRPPQTAPTLNMSGCTVNICFNLTPPPLPPLSILEFTAEELNEPFRPMYASCVCSFVTILMLLTRLLSLAAADSFFDLFTVS